jgi:hypothetical protein
MFQRNVVNNIFYTASQPRRPQSISEPVVVVVIVVVVVVVVVCPFTPRRAIGP